VSKHHQTTLCYIALERNHEKLAQLSYALKTGPNAEDKKEIEDEIKEVKRKIARLNKLA
jgi:hypothetical protein